MSVPRLLYAESYREPLLPLENGGGSSGSSGSGGGDPLNMSSKRSETSDADISDQLEIASQTFTTEPFHRFGNAAAAGHRRAAAFPRVPAGGKGGGDDGSSEGRLTGGIDGNSDPEVAAYVVKERGGHQPGVSGSSVRPAANCGKT